MAAIATLRSAISRKRSASLSPGCACRSGMTITAPGSATSRSSALAGAGTNHLGTAPSPPRSPVPEGLRGGVVEAEDGDGGVRRSGRLFADRPQDALQVDPRRQALRDAGQRLHQLRVAVPQRRAATRPRGSLDRSRPAPSGHPRRPLGQPSTSCSSSREQTRDQRAGRPPIAQPHGSPIPAPDLGRERAGPVIAAKRHGTVFKRVAERPAASSSPLHPPPLARRRRGRATGPVRSTTGTVRAPSPTQEMKEMNYSKLAYLVPAGLLVVATACGPSAGTVEKKSESTTPRRPREPSRPRASPPRSARPSRRSRRRRSARPPVRPARRPRRSSGRSPRSPRARSSR